MRCETGCHVTRAVDSAVVVDDRSSITRSIIPVQPAVAWPVHAPDTPRCEQQRFHSPSGVVLLAAQARPQCAAAPPSQASSSLPASLPARGACRRCSAVGHTLAALSRRSRCAPSAHDTICRSHRAGARTRGADQRAGGSACGFSSAAGAGAAGLLHPLSSYSHHGVESGHC